MAYDEAAAHLTTAVTALRRAGADTSELAARTVELARAHYLAGNLVEALAECERAAALARSANEAEQPALLAAAALVVRWVSFPRAADVVSRLCRAALAVEQPAPIRSQLLSQVATVLADAGPIEPAREAAAEAMRLAADSGAAQALLDAARAREMTLVDPEDVHERMRLAEIVAGQAEALGRSLSGVLAEQWRLRSAYQLGRLDLVEAAMAATARLADRAGLPLARWHQLRGQAARAVLEGRFAAARTHNLAARRLASAFGDPLAVGLSYALAQHLATLRGDPGELPDDFWAAFATAPPSPMMTGFRGSALLVQGRRDEAQVAFEQLRPFLDRPVDERGWGGLIIQLVDLVETFGDAAAARGLADRLRPFAGFPGAYGAPTAIFVGSMRGLYGRVLARAGALADAETALRTAIDDDTALGARPHVVLNRLALADVLRRRADPSAAMPAATKAAADATGAADGTVAAEEAASAAAAEARRLDMPGPLARADRLLAELVASRRARNPLSPREEEVARLVSRALSNREIAARLVLSERTIESHVRSILAKFGYANRTELVARWPG
jgi:DNA-binding CsgD family transcriptional regulator